MITQETERINLPYRKEISEREAAIDQKQKEKEKRLHMARKKESLSNQSQYLNKKSQSGLGQIMCHRKNNASC
eukprot:313690-Amorphochlora_amoeboformis.AAC.1